MADKGIPAPPHIRDPELRRFLYALYRNIQTLLGEQGKTDDRAVLISDLRNLGILGVDTKLVGTDQTDLIFDPNAPAAQSLTSPQPVTYNNYVDLTGEPYVDRFGNTYIGQTGVP